VPTEQLRYTGPVPRLGSLVLASVLLGVPRALEARTFGAQRSFYVDVSREASGLAPFAEALSHALAASAWSLAPRRAQATTVIDVVSVLTTTDARGRPVEAFTLSISERGRVRRLILHGRPDDRAKAARELVGRLSPLDS
jgi:hypothetical protein